MASIKIIYGCTLHDLEDGGTVYINCVLTCVSISTTKDVCFDRCVFSHLRNLKGDGLFYSCIFSRLRSDEVPNKSIGNVFNGTPPDLEYLYEEW